MTFGTAELPGVLASPSQGPDESATPVHNGDDRGIGVQGEQVAAAVEPQARRCPELSPIGRVHVTHPEQLDELRGQGTISVQGVIRHVGAGTCGNGQREGPHSNSSAHGVLFGALRVLSLSGWVESGFERSCRERARGVYGKIRWGGCCPDAPKLD